MLGSRLEFDRVVGWGRGGINTHGQQLVMSQAGRGGRFIHDGWVKSSNKIARHTVLELQLLMTLNYTNNS